MLDKIKKWLGKFTDKIYYLPKEYRTHVPPEKPDESTTVDPICLLYTSPSPRDATLSRMPSSA